MIIQCKNQAQYDLLSSQPLTIPLYDLKIDIDEDFISSDIQKQFQVLGEQ